MSEDVHERKNNHRRVSLLLLLKRGGRDLLKKELENRGEIGQRIKEYESTHFPLASALC